MGRQTLDRIKKIVSVLLAVLFVVSLTASAGAACEEENNLNPGLSSDIPAFDGFDLDKLFSGSGFIPSTGSNDDYNSILSQFGI